MPVHSGIIMENNKEEPALYGDRTIWEELKESRNNAWMILIAMLILIFAVVAKYS